ncbi:hypothetical protein HOI71_09600, partial [Candidatus Poribacteria bacterium]|nr:hypothetical protein [Candidatus Poribacteria bacterium]
YGVTMVRDFLTSVADEGDELLAQAFESSDGVDAVRGQAVHTITAAEEAQQFGATIDIRLSGVLVRFDGVSIPGDGASVATISVDVTGRDGNPVEGDTLTAAAEAGTVGVFTALGGGRYQATFRGPPTAETISVTVAVTSALVEDARGLATISVEGVASSITVTIADPALEADGTSTTTITAALDRNGIPIVDETLDMSVVDGSGSVGRSTNNNDGTYTATYLAGTEAGTVTVSARTSVSGNVGVASLLLRPGPPVRIASVAVSPSVVRGNGVATAIFTATIVDAHGNAVGGVAGISATVVEGVGTVGEVSDTGDGTYVAVYTSDFVSEAGASTVDFRAESLETNSATLSLSPEPSAETPVMAFQGSVFLQGGDAFAPNGLSVTVVVVPRDSTQEATVGSGGNGRYTVTFLDFTGESVAASGDLARVTVTDASGALRGSAERRLTADDVNNGSTVVDVETDIPASSSVIAVTGLVTYADGKTPISDAETMTVHVDVGGSHDSAPVGSAGPGRYSIAFVNFERPFATGEEVRVEARRNGNAVGTLVHLLTSTQVLGRLVEAGATVTTLTASGVNRPPVFEAATGVTHEVSAGRAFSLPVSVSDPDGDSVQVSVAGRPDGARFVDGSVLEWQPTVAQSGPHQISFTARDGRGGAAEAIVSITVVVVPPEWTSVDPPEVVEGEELRLEVRATHPQSFPITFAFTSDPELTGVTTRQPDGLLFRWRPDFDDAGVYALIFTATDSRGVSSDLVTALTVIDSNRAPSVGTVPRHEATEGHGFSTSLLDFVSDPDVGDRDRLSFTLAAGSPLGLTLSDTGVVQWTPLPADANSHEVEFRATDPSGASDSGILGLYVHAAPILVVEPSHVVDTAEATTVSVTVSATDRNSEDSLAMGWVDASVVPTWIASQAAPGNPAQFAVTVSPTFDVAGSGVFELTLQVQASDSSSEALSQTVALTIRVTDANRPPSISVPTRAFTVDEGSAVSFRVTATDPDGDPLAFSGAGLPDRARINSESGQFDFSPDFRASGSYPIVLRVTDDEALSAEAEIVLEVSDVAVLSISPNTPQSVSEGEEITVQTSLVDSAIGQVAVRPTDPPPNAQWDAGTGALTFSPDFTQNGEYVLEMVALQDADPVTTRAVVVRVTDAPAFVLDPNGGRVVRENGEITITVQRSPNADDSVVLSAVDVPRSATFDAATGIFHFSPDFAQQGTHHVDFQAFQANQLVDSALAAFSVTNVDFLSTTPSGPHEVDEGGHLSVQVNVAPEAGAKVTLAAVDLPRSAFFDPSTGSFTFSPDFNQGGEHLPTIRATQDGRTAEEETLRIAVNDVPLPPTVTVAAPMNVTTGDVSVAYAIADVDGDPVSLSMEYRRDPSGAWTAASVEGPVANTTAYSGSLTWLSREDVPSTSGVDVQLRVTPFDTIPGASVTTGTFHLVNLLGDYDDDRDVEFDDFALFTQAWRAKDIGRDIGPATGTPPDLIPTFDGVIDFDDLATFVVMWNWSAKNSSVATPAMVLDDGEASLLRHEATVDRSDWRRQHLAFALDVPAYLLAARVTLQYDPLRLRIRPGKSGGENRGRVSLYLHDEGSGILEVQTAWLAGGAPPDVLASFQAEILLSTDAELRVTSDIRDRLNRSRRGRRVVRLRFEAPPAHTALLQNYPNPFNPETWIPFDLSQDAEVVVRIYDLQGVLVRTLRPGERTTGRYRDRARAVYWDGANEQGESAASGVYVYELGAGEYQEVRRMVIRK